MLGILPYLQLQLVQQQQQQQQQQHNFLYIRGFVWPAVVSAYPYYMYIAMPVYSCDIRSSTAAYQLGTVSSRMITEVKRIFS